MGGKEEQGRETKQTRHPQIQFSLSGPISGRMCGSETGQQSSPVSPPDCSRLLRGFPGHVVTPGCLVEKGQWLGLHFEQCPPAPTPQTPTPGQHVRCQPLLSVIPGWKPRSVLLLQLSELFQLSETQFPYLRNGSIAGKLWE